MKNILKGEIQKMSKYVSRTYSSGSILERASYKRNEMQRQGVYKSSLIEQRIPKKGDNNRWGSVKVIMQRFFTI